MTYGRRVDANQGEIVRELRRAGALVFNASQLGRGFPDLVVIHGGVILAEIKQPGEPLTPMEQAFHQAALAHGGSICIWYTAEDALERIGAISRVPDRGTVEINDSRESGSRTGTFYGTI